MWASRFLLRNCPPDRQLILPNSSHRVNRNQSRAASPDPIAQHRGPMQPMQELRPTRAKEALPSLKETAAGTRRSIGTTFGCRSRLGFC